MEKNKASILQTVNLLARLICLLAIVYFALRWIDSCEQQDDITIEDTPVVIESIKPIGELYAYTAITEDFSIDNVEKVGFFRKSYYKAVQTLRAQVSYVMDLDSVKYQRKAGTDTVVVTLPQLCAVVAGRKAAVRGGDGRLRRCQRHRCGRGEDTQQV